MTERTQREMERNGNRFRASGAVPARAVTAGVPAITAPVGQVWTQCGGGMGSGVFGLGLCEVGLRGFDVTCRGGSSSFVGARS